MYFPYVLHINGWYVSGGGTNLIEMCELIFYFHTHYVSLSLHKDGSGFIRF